MQCANCGHNSSEGSRFCARCGTELNAPAPEPVATAPAPPVPPPTDAATAAPPPPQPQAPPTEPQPWGAPPRPWGAPPPPGASAPPPPPGAYASDPSAPPNPYAPPPVYAPGYGSYQPQPGYGYYPPSTNGLAIAALVLGLAGWLVCGVGSLLAVIFGFVAKSQIRNSQGRQGGSGMATAGIVLGFVGIALVILWIVLIAAGNNTSS